MNDASPASAQWRCEHADAVAIRALLAGVFGQGL
jgi:hypothetical protein